MSDEANIYAVSGEDDYLVESAVAKIVAKAVPQELRSTAVETVAGSAPNAELQLQSVAACRLSLLTPPFLDPVKLTWWRGVSFIPGASGKTDPVAEAVKAALEAFVSEIAAAPPPPNQFFVVSAPKIPPASVFAKRLKSAGAVFVDCGIGGGKSRDRLEAAMMRLPDLAAEAGLSFAPGAAEAFIARTGADTRFIVAELEKLRCYLGKPGQTATAADVAEITSPGSEEPELWDVTDALAARNPAKLLAALARFSGKSGSGILFATVAEKFFREAALYRDAMDRKWLTPYGTWAKDLPPEAEGDLNDAGIGPKSAKNAWAVKRGAKNAANYSLQELRMARALVLRARESLVSSGADDSAVSETLLRICSARRRT